MPRYWLRWHLVNFFQGWLPTAILPILASQVSRITVVSHWCPVRNNVLKRFKSKFQQEKHFNKGSILREEVIVTENQQGILRYPETTIAEHWWYSWV
jgi:hypothetical protein